LIRPIGFHANDDISGYALSYHPAPSHERADGVAGLVPAELERRLEAVAAEGAAGRADEGTWIDEFVVPRAGAVGAAKLPAVPICALLSRRGALRDPFRRRPLALHRRRLVRSSRLQERKRGKHAYTGKEQFSHDSPPQSWIFPETNFG